MKNHERIAEEGTFAIRSGDGNDGTNEFLVQVQWEGLQFVDLANYRHGPGEGFTVPWSEVARLRDWLTFILSESGNGDAKAR